MANIEQNGVSLPKGSPAAIDMGQTTLAGDGAFLIFMAQTVSKLGPLLLAIAPQPPAEADLNVTLETTSFPFESLPNAPKIVELGKSPKEAEPATGLKHPLVGADCDGAAVKGSVGHGSATTFKDQTHPARFAQQQKANSLSEAAENDVAEPDLPLIQPNGYVISETLKWAKQPPLQINTPPFAPEMEVSNAPALSDQRPVMALQPPMAKHAHVSDSGFPTDVEPAKVALASDRGAMNQNTRFVQEVLPNVDHSPTKINAQASSPEPQLPLPTQIWAFGWVTNLSEDVNNPAAEFQKAQAFKPESGGQGPRESSSLLGVSLPSFIVSPVGALIETNSNIVAPISSQIDRLIPALAKSESSETLTGRSTFDLRISTAAELDVQGAAIEPQAVFRPEMAMPASRIAYESVKMKPSFLLSGERLVPQISPIRVVSVEQTPPKAEAKMSELALGEVVKQAAMTAPQQVQSMIRFEVRLTTEPTVFAPIFPVSPGAISAPAVNVITVQNPSPLLALVAQIREHVEPGKQTRMELMLSPEDLGKIRLNMTPDGDRLRIVLQAERPEILEMLRRNTDALAAELREAGFASTSFSFGSWNETPDEGTNPDREKQGERFDGAQLATVPQAQTYQLASSTGLDLRV